MEWFCNGTATGSSGVFTTRPLHNLWLVNREPVTDTQELQRLNLKTPQPEMFWKQRAGTSPTSGNGPLVAVTLPCVSELGPTPKT